MQPISAVAIFCEDIREEQSGQNTIVGTLPDNLVLQPPPVVPSGSGVPSGLFGKLAIYVRINFDVDNNPKDVSVRLLNTNGTVVTKMGWDRSVIDKAFADSKKNKMPLVGLILKVVVGPIPVVGSGKITVIATIDGSETIAGALNIIAPAANASPPPA